MSNNTLNWDIESNRHARGVITNVIFILLITNYIAGVYWFDVEGRYADWFALGFGAGVLHFFIQGREINFYSFIFQTISKFKISIISKD